MDAASWGSFDEGPLTIEERIPVKGRARQDEVWRIYVQQEGITVPLFDTQGLGSQILLAFQTSPLIEAFDDLIIDFLWVKNRFWKE